MAGIDKLRADYYDYNELRIWCITHNPSLLNRFYEPFLTYKEWENMQYDIMSKHEQYKHIEDDGINYCDVKLIIAHFISFDDKYLYWHCPLDFVRKYLETQCGYKKANWFVKLFWKY